MCYLLGVTGLRDKVVLVTGASGGIGEAIAVEFARGGAVVVVSSRNEECGWRGGDGVTEIGIMDYWNDGVINTTLMAGQSNTPLQ